jgi:hypothetical protein
MANCPFSQCIDQELLKSVKGNKNIIKKILSTDSNPSIC